MEKFYKWIDKSCTTEHVYHDGDNDDPRPFHPTKGVYYAQRDILAYIGYAENLYEVTPIGEVYDLTGVLEKFKASDVKLKYVGKRFDPAIIKRLICEGANIHAYQDAALKWASYKGYFEIIKVLLECGLFNVDIMTETLVWAADKAPLEIIQALLDKHAKADGRALAVAASKNRIDIMRLFMAEGARIEDDGNGNWALVRAAENGQLETVMCLLEAGANPFAINYMACRKASEKGYMKTHKILKEAIQKRGVAMQRKEFDRFEEAEACGKVL